MRSFLVTIAISIICCLVISPQLVSAQSDAEIAMEKARKAFADEQFDIALNLLVIASQTDTDNPDVFLLLGKTHYQRGEIDQAIVAWKRTLKLAPNLAYAKMMVDRIQGKILNADVRLQAVESLLRQRLPQLAQYEIQAIKRNSLSDSQLIKLLSLESQMLVDIGQGVAALKPLNELTIRDPAQSANPNIRLLIAKAKLNAGDDSVPEALVMLDAIKTDFADTPESTSADLALISYRIQQGDDAIEQLVSWIQANPQHRDLPLARQTMIESVSVFVQVASLQPKPSKNEPLSPADISVLAAAEQAFAFLSHADDSLNLAKQIVSHVQSRWVANGSYQTANQAYERLLKLKLAPSSRAALEGALLQSTNAAASKQLDEILVAVQEGDATAATLSAWIDSNGSHPRIQQAQAHLVSAHLETTRRTGASKLGDELSDSDQSAIILAVTLVKTMKTTAEKTQIIQGLLDHLAKQYAASGAHAAAIAGQQSLLQAKLPRLVRRAILGQLAATQTEQALTRLNALAAAGTLNPGPLPTDLADLLATYQTINTEYPAQPVWF